MLVVPKREVERRISRIVSAMESRGLEGLYLASPANVTYVTNFAFIPTERPIAAFIDGGGEVTLFVPLLEYEHALRYSYADNVVYYEEYPGEVHPMVLIGGRLMEMGFEGKRVGYDVDGYGHVYGYRGPRLSDVLKAGFSYERDLVEDVRMVKSKVEVELIRESARWASYAHRLLQEYARPGALEDEVSLRASAEATAAMVKALGALEGRYGPWIGEARAGFRGQVGPHSYYPHSLSIHAVIRRGHVLVTGAGARICGYSAELERTMVVGRPTQDQERYFRMMLEARRVAMEVVKPGARCSEVDRAVRRYYKEKGIWDAWRHHAGHGIGLEIHEAPFLDVGDERELKPGMVLSIEPGIYVKNLGGFRHSDTIVVTEEGYERITNYPEDLEDLVIEA